MVKSFIPLAHGGKFKCHGNLPYNFNPRICRYCGKLLQYFYNMDPWSALVKGFEAKNYKIEIFSGKKVL